MDVQQVLSRIQELENELEGLIEEQRSGLQESLSAKRRELQEEVLRRHRELRTGVVKYLVDSGVLSVVTAPIIYALIIPLLMLDAFVTLYQFICFPVYGIKKVPRSDFIVLDRHHLAYLNPIEKLNCAYCGYANGLLSYAREIAGRSEAYWCPIKHASRSKGQHRAYWEFAGYGNAEEFRSEEVKVAQHAKARRRRFFRSDED